MLAITEAQADISFDAMAERQRKIADIIRNDPAVLYVNSTVGVGGPNSSLNNGRMLVALKPKHERGPLERDHSARCGGRPAQVTGMTVFFQMIQNINVGGRINKSQYQYTLQSSDTETLYKHRAGIARQDRQGRRPARRDHRSLRHQSAGDDRRRSREGGGVRRHHRPDPPGAVRRLRQPPGRDDLHAEQRLPGDPGDQAGVSARSDEPAEHLREDQRRRRGRSRRPGAAAGPAAASPATASRRDSRSRCPR